MDLNSFLKSESVFLALKNNPHFSTPSTPAEQTDGL